MLAARIKIDGGEMRLLNDDEVFATIDSPEDILHQLLIIGGYYGKTRENKTVDI